MKIIKHIVLFAAAALLGGALAGCEGKSEENGPKIVLSADKSLITADGSDAVTFTVRYDGADVTGQATILCTNDNTTVSGASFTTAAAGTYRFVASLDGMTSNTFAVTAEAATVTASQFERHVALMEFTGAWCTFCPDGMRYLEFVLESYDNVHMMALHSSQGKDEMAIPLTDEIGNAFRIQGYPSALVDLRNCRLLATDRSEVRPDIKASLAEGAHCGVAVTSAVDGSTVKVGVRLFSERTENYRIAVYVVEDHITYYQKDGSLTFDDYDHRHVVRGIFSPGSFRGDNLGEVASGTEAEKSYEFTLDSKWNLDNTEIYVLAMDASGQVNNMNRCAIAGGEADYNRTTNE